VVSKISQFMHSLRTSYLEAINRVLRYLNRIPGKGILINKIMSLMRFGAILIQIGSKVVIRSLLSTITHL
jgi:hypothetical protein